MVSRRLVSAITAWHDLHTTLLRIYGGQQTDEEEELEDEELANKDHRKRSNSVSNFIQQDEKFESPSTSSSATSLPNKMSPSPSTISSLHNNANASLEINSNDAYWLRGHSPRPPQPSDNNLQPTTSRQPRKTVRSLLQTKGISVKHSSPNMERFSKYQQKQHEEDDIKRCTADIGLGSLLERVKSTRRKSA
jgi:hypothetical protein